MSGGFAAILALSANRSVPLTAHLELTYRCNVRCAHCFQDRGFAPRELGLDDWLATVDRARAAGALIVTLSGGEAMLSPHFWKVAEHARGLGMALRIFTNGVLLTRENVRRIAALRPLAVEVSVFSLRPEVHDAVTGARGSLAKALRGLFRLKRARVPVTVKCPLLSVSGDDYPAVRRLAERLGASILFDPQISPRFDGGSGPTRCRGDDQTVGAYLADPITRGYDRASTVPTSAASAPCGMGRSFVVVSPEGEVLPCPMLQISAGNVKDRPLDAIWRESPLMERLRARRFGDLPVCSTCPRSGYCDRCSAIALLEDGDLDGPSARACHIAELRERAWGLPPPVNAPEPKQSGLRVLQDGACAGPGISIVDRAAAARGSGTKSVTVSGKG